MIFLNIDRNKKISLTKQIFEQLRGMILNGELISGEKLPSTRKFANELKVSRNTIIEVYDQLFAEGYLESREGAGTYVANGTLLEKFSDIYKNEENEDYKNKNDEKRNLIHFASGVPDLNYFPRIKWAKFLKEAVLDINNKDMDYPDIQGLYDLRNILSKYLFRTKGIKTAADEIFILSGSAEAFIILSELLKINNKNIIIEDPSYNGIINIFKKKKLKLVPVPVDEKGIIIKKLPADNNSYNIIVTPSHQFPTGSVLPIQRRIELINFAVKTESFILENDYDSEFRFTSPPINSLHLLNRDRVIHIGTFSETMYPALRIGYMVVPKVLIEKIKELKYQCIMFTSTIKQYALMNFIQNGYYERHIAKMKKVYLKKQQFLIKILHKEFPDQIKITGDSTGLYIAVEFKNINISDELLNRLIENNIIIYPVKDHIINNFKYKNKILLGFGNLDVDQIQKGIKTIKKIKPLFYTNHSLFLN